MDLRKLEIVKAVAETGSFTAAARLLHVSQSAISRQVLLLEEEPLFVRLGRRVRLTQTGEALLQLSHRLLADVRETTTAIVEHHTKQRGTMHLARIIHERCAFVHNAPAALVHPARRRADGEGNGLGLDARPARAQARAGDVRGPRADATQAETHCAEAHVARSAERQ